MLKLENLFGFVSIYVNWKYIEVDNNQMESTQKLGTQTERLNVHDINCHVIVEKLGSFIRCYSFNKTDNCSNERLCVALWRPIFFSSDFFFPYFSVRLHTFNCILLYLIMSWFIPFAEKYFHPELSQYNL